MKPILVFYHGYTGGRSLGMNIIAEQMQSLQQSGLAEAAREIHIGCELDRVLDVALLAPDKAELYPFPTPVESELPTLRILRDSMAPGLYVCYFHSKSAAHATDIYRSWRESMERACVWEWPRAIQALENGHDVAGIRWSNPVKHDTYPPGQRYFEGNFWWASSDYLMTLAPLVEPQYQARSEKENRYEAEVWIGKSRQEPRVFHL